MVLGIYGSGNLGREIHEMASQSAEWEEIIFIDDTVEPGIFRNTRRIPFELFRKKYSVDNTKVVIALGEPAYRVDLYNKCKEEGYGLANIIYPLVWISQSAKLGEGVIIYPHTFISCNTIVEDNVFLGPGVMIGHDCMIHRNSQISSGVAFGGNCVVGEGVYIGMNVPVKEKIKIGANSVIGMGSVVSRDIPDNVIALGNPARVMKYKDDNKVFK